MKKTNIKLDITKFKEITNEKELKNIEGGTLGGFTSTISKFFKDLFK